MIYESISVDAVWYRTRQLVVYNNEYMYIKMLEYCYSSS